MKNVMFAILMLAATINTAHAFNGAQFAAVDMNRGARVGMIVGMVEMAFADHLIKQSCADDMVLNYTDILDKVLYDGANETNSKKAALSDVFLAVVWILYPQCAPNEFNKFKAAQK